MYLKTTNCLPNAVLEADTYEYMSYLYQFQQRLYNIFTQEMGATIISITVKYLLRIL
jgi:hypothetical protein